MISYVIDVALGSIGIGVVSLILLLVFNFTFKWKYGKVIKYWFIMLFCTVIYNMLLSSNTYKHEVFDKNVDIMQIKASKPTSNFEIKDNTKPLGIIPDEDFDNKVKYK